MQSLPAVWVSEGKKAVGRIELLPDRICLDGSCEGSGQRQELHQSQIRSVREATITERISSNPTLVIEPVCGPTIWLMPVLASLALILDLIQQMQLGG